MLEKTDGAIDFTQPAARVAARIRGVDPWPGAYATAPRPAAQAVPRASSPTGPPPAALGTVLAIDAAGLHVACSRRRRRDPRGPGRRASKRMAGAARSRRGGGIADRRQAARSPSRAATTVDERRRELARRVLERIERDKAWATPALDGELARAGLDDRDRRLASELVYGVLRHRARLDRALAAHADLKKTPLRVVIALRVAAYQLLFLDRVPAYAAVDDAVGAARAAGGAKLAGFANAVLRKVGSGARAGVAAIRRDSSSSTRCRAWILDELARRAIPTRRRACCRVRDLGAARRAREPPADHARGA